LAHSIALAGVAAEAEVLQVADVVRAALVTRHDGDHLQGPLVPADAANVRPRAWFSTRTFTESLAAQLRQLFALGVAQPCCCAEAFGYAAHQAVGALVVVSDAVAGEHPANQARRIRRAKSYAEPSRRRPGNSVAQALHEHQRLALMAHAGSQRFDAEI